MWSGVAPYYRCHYFLLLPVRPRSRYRGHPYRPEQVFGDHRDVQDPDHRPDGDRPGRVCPVPRPQRPAVDPGRLLGQGPKYQRQMLWGILGLFVVLFGAMAVRLLQILIEHSFQEPTDARPPANPKLARRSKKNTSGRPASTTRAPRSPRAATSRRTRGCSCASPAWR